MFCQCFATRLQINSWCFAKVLLVFCLWRSCVLLMSCLCSLTTDILWLWRLKSNLRNSFSPFLTKVRHVLNNHTFYVETSGVSGLRRPLYSGRRNWCRLKITFRMLTCLGRFTKIVSKWPLGISFPNWEFLNVQKHNMKWPLGIRIPNWEFLNEQKHIMKWQLRISILNWEFLNVHKHNMKSPLGISIPNWEFLNVQKHIMKSSLGVSIPNWESLNVQKHTMKWPLGILTAFGELKIYELNGVGRPRGARLPSSICLQISFVVTVVLQTGCWYM